MVIAPSYWLHPNSYASYSLGNPLPATNREERLKERVVALLAEWGGGGGGGVKPSPGRGVGQMVWLKNIITI